MKSTESIDVIVNDFNEKYKFFILNKQEGFASKITKDGQLELDFYFLIVFAR